MAASLDLAKVASKSLLDLPDELLYKIFEHAGSKAIISLSFCNKRLHQICYDSKLWRVANFSAYGSTLSLKEAWLATQFLLPSTISLSMSAHDFSQQTFSRELLNTIKMKCPSLHTLELIDWKLETRLNEFPAQLLRLSLIGSKPCELMELERQIHNEENNGPFPRTSYFFDIVKHIPRLQSLNLTRCRWLNSHSLLALSKITCLRELVLNDCYRIGNNIAYTALASGMGFYTLERVDLRNTKVDDGDLKNFLTLPNMQEIYFGLDLGHQDPRTPLTDEELLNWDEARGPIGEGIPCYKLPEEPLPAIYSPLDQVSAVSPQQEKTESHMETDALEYKQAENSLDEEIKSGINSDSQQQIATEEMAEETDALDCNQAENSLATNSLDEKIKVPAMKDCHILQLLTTQEIVDRNMESIHTVVCNTFPIHSWEGEKKIGAVDVLPDQDQAPSTKKELNSKCCGREKPARKIRRLQSPQPGSSKRIPEVVDLADSDEDLPRKVPRENTPQPDSSQKPVELICLSSDEEQMEVEVVSNPSQPKKLVTDGKAKRHGTVGRKKTADTARAATAILQRKLVDRIRSQLAAHEANTEPVSSCSTSESSTEPVSSCSTSETSTEPSSSCSTSETSTEPVSSCSTSETSTEPVRSCSTSESSTEPVSSCSTSETSTEPVRSCSTSETSTEPLNSHNTSEASDEPSSSSSTSAPNPAIQVLMSNKKRTPLEWRLWREHRNFEWEDTDPGLDSLEDTGNNIIVVNVHENTVYRAHSIQANLNEPQTYIPGEKITSSIADYPICEHLRILCATGCTGINNEFLTRLGEHGLKHLELVDVRETSITPDGVTLFTGYHGENVKVNL